MEFVRGRIPTNTFTNIPSDQRHAVMMAIVRTLGKLHRFDPKQIGLVGGVNEYGKATGYYLRQIKTMEKVTRQQVREFVWSCVVCC
jgi:aminoglycoside phosphotransferase (APT) family kinase protein